MALQVSAAYKEEGRIERGKRRVNARYSLRNVLSIILALFSLSPYLSLSLGLRNERKFHDFTTFTTRFNCERSRATRGEKRRNERCERDETTQPTV